MPRTRRFTGSFALNRSSLLVDLAQQKSEENRQQIQDNQIAKAARNDAWGAEAQKLQDLTDKLLSGQMTITDFRAAIADSRKSFPEHVSTVDRYERSGLTANDQQHFNDFINGNITWEDWQSYYKDSRKAGGDNATLDKLNTQAIRRQQIQTDVATQSKYTTGQLDAKSYTDYLDARIGQEKDPAALNSLKTERFGVQKNEFNKLLDDIKAKVDGGLMSPAEAATRLNGLRTTAPDPVSRNNATTMLGQLVKMSTAAKSSVQA